MSPGNSRASMNGCVLRLFGRRQPPSIVGRIGMSEAWLGLAVLAAPPALVIGASYVDLDVERLRRQAVASAVLMLLAAIGVAVSPHLWTFSVRVPALARVAGGDALVRIDNLSAVLVPFAARPWLLAFSVTPRGAPRPGGVGRPPPRPAHTPRP